MIDYGEAINNIFKNKKRNSNYSPLNSIPSLKSQENTSPRVKKSDLNETIDKIHKEESKNNNTNNINNNNKELRIINDDDLNNINSDEKILNVKNDELIIKLQKELIEKNGNFVDNNKSKNKNLSNNKNTRNKKKEKELKNILNNENGANENLFSYENDLNFNLNSLQNNIKEQKKNNFISLNKISKNPNYFEQYNTEELAYNAMKNYSNCKPKEKNFLSRMQFYSVKRQTKSNIIDLMVKEAIPKIKESEKILTFNRLIEDANRRLENKNNNFYNNDNLFYDDSLNKILNNKTKKKFNQIEFENKYKENITERLKEKEIKLELLRQQKKKEDKAKEDIIVQQMKKRNKTATKKQIEKISKRLYNESSNRIKKNIYNSLNEFEDNLKKNINENQNDNISKSYNYPKRKFGNNNLISNTSKNKLNRKKKYNNTNTYTNNNTSINSFDISKPNTYRKEPISYKQQILNKMKKNISLDDNSNLNNDIKRENNKSKIIPYYTAEKMIDNFFDKK